MKNNKLLSSLKKAIQAAEIMMDSSSDPAKMEGTVLSGGGGSKKVIIKKADFTKPNIGLIEFEECPNGVCPPVEFEGRCCIFDPSAGWSCQDGLMASECAQQGGVYEQGVTCADEPACGQSDKTSTTMPASM